MKPGGTVGQPYSHGWGWAIGYNEFDFFLENKEYRPFDWCKFEI
jgi:hypothetical protein